MNSITSYYAASELSDLVTDILMKLGINASSCGYDHMRCAIILAYYEPEITVYATKTLYPRVARLRHAASAGSVARNCRRVVEQAICSKADILTEIFGEITPAHSPSCANFILTVANHIHSLTSEL